MVNSLKVTEMKKIQFDIYPDGTQCWYLNGDLHREDGPAKIFLDGSQFWYLNDKLHREDGPAVIYSNSTQFWFLNEELQIDNK